MDEIEKILRNGLKEEFKELEFTDAVGFVIDPKGLIHVPGFLPMDPWEFGYYQTYRKHMH